MSNKAETMKKSKRTLTPKLRFPEFGAGEGWQTPQLSDLYCFKRTNTLSRDKLNYEAGTIKNIHYGDIHTKFKPLFRVDHEYVPFINPEVSVDAFEEEDDCEEGDIVLADASEDLNDVGKAIEIISLDGQRVVAGTHTILATRHGSMPVVGFGAHLFQSAAVRAGLQRESQGAKVYGISANRISPVVLPLPPTKHEQQKIADCLSSLDVLIAAAGRKLAALRDHKRGLMQQLFPQPGQTQPRLRFPEFRDKGEWVERELSELLPIGSSKRVHQRDWARDGVPFYRAREIVAIHNGEQISPLYISEKLYAENVAKTGAISGGDLLVTGVGSIGVPYLVKPSDRFYFKDGNIIWLKNDESELIGSFLHLLYQTSYVQSQITKMAGVGTVGTYTIDNAKRTQVVFPCEPTEQRKVANCISILDSLITAQTVKIETLKQHKRGLMQQLFPAPEEQ